MGFAIEDRYLPLPT